MSYAVLMWFMVSAGAQAEFVALPEGETPLTDIGFFRVAYQSYDGKQVDMPAGFVGTDGPSGIVYQPNESLLGREAVMMHSPWRVPVGKTWVDYAVHLPDKGPVSLRFGIAMRGEVLTPDKSDGVTFSAYVLDAGGTHELMREHYAKGDWKDVQFDLAPYASKDVTIRLQVEPGPANNPGWDYSYISIPVLRVGTGERSAALSITLLGSRAVKASANADMTRAANDPAHGVAPSTLLDVQNKIEADGASYRFVCAGADCDVVYTYTPASGTLDDFSAAVDGGAPFQPALGGGVTGVVRKDGHDDFVFLRGGSAKSIDRAPDGTALNVVWTYPLGDRAVEVAWRFGVRGKALLVEADCTEPVLSALSLGHEGNVAFRKPLTVPYLLGTMSYLAGQGTFVCRYLDWTVSHASMTPQGEATYEPKTDGTRNALHESGYIAISPNVADVLPNLPNPPSPFRTVLATRIMLDIWQHHGGTFSGDAANLRGLKDNGVDHLAIIDHAWQRYGYDVKLPDHFPAIADLGGSDGMKEFGKAANECGYLWSLHENYIDLYPDAPSYDPAARALQADGTPTLGWYNAGTKVQSFGMKCIRSLDFAKQNSPKIHAEYGTTAAYLDVHTCVPPWHDLDHDASVQMASMQQLKFQRDTELFQYERDTHGGPLFGEGNNQFFWAGRCDGVEAQVSGGEDHAPFLDFDLLKIHPQMVNHGMGYFERWFRRGYEHRWGIDTGTAEQVDKYRAQEIAYGHAGFVSGGQADNVQWVAKEHHMMHPIQRLMNAAKVTAISYEVDGQMAPAGVALATGQRWRQRIAYDSGLRVWINWAKDAWTVDGRVLPQWGFLALGPDTECETILKDGHFADYASCPEFVFADARTSFNMPYLTAVKNIAPRVRKFEWTGGNTARVTYEWNVNDTLDRDYMCFVHFTNPSAGGDGIVFQQDHALPKPTGQWKPGDVIVDGPYDIAIPDNANGEYKVAVGLFGDDRVVLTGPRDKRNRVVLGKLIVQRDGTKIIDAHFDPAPATAVSSEEDSADFHAHMNAPGTAVDFGPLATDGSVKINRSERELVVFPYPRDRAFTVALDIAKIAGGAPASRESLHIVALAASTQAELGDVPFDVRDGRVVFTVGMKGAGRYRIRW